MLDDHPFRQYFTKQFPVTLNTDNRLMSNTTLSDEFALTARTFGLGFDDLEKIVINGMKSAFIPYVPRCDVIFGRIKPGFAALREAAAMA